MNTWSASIFLSSPRLTRARWCGICARYGVMRGVISSLETNPEVLVAKARSIRKMDGTDLASVVTTKVRL